MPARSRSLPALAAVATTVVAALLPLARAVPTSAAAGWTQAQPPTSPAPRGAVGMAYDESRHVTVLFGGTDTHTLFGDTWEWDGSSWTRRTPTSSPSPRFGQAMAYDAASRSILLVGGVDAHGIEGDTWSWDGSAWTEHCAACDPAPRAFAAVAGDTGRGRVVLVGGLEATRSTVALGDDTWEWDGSHWARASAGSGATGSGSGICVDAAGATVPPARAGSAAVYDSVRGRTVLVGGATGGCTYGDTWEWDGHGWTEARPSPDPGTAPHARAVLAAAFDAVRGRTFVFGGCSGSTGYADDWEWDGAQWTDVTAASGNGPSARSFSGMAFDGARGREVLFGGGTPGQCSYDTPPVADGQTWQRTGPVPATVASNLTLTTDESTIPAGAAGVALAAIPSARVAAIVDAPAVNVLQPGATPVNGSTGSAPIGSVPIGNVPIGNVPIGNIPIGNIPIGNVPIGNVPIGSIGLGGVPAGGTTLDAVTLGSIPAVDWQTVLAGSALAGLPLQTLTLRQALADPVAGSRVAALSLAQVDPSSSLLRGTPVTALLLGSLPLDRIPVPSATTPTWCAYLTALNWAPAQSCTDGAGGNVDTSRTTVVGLSIAGAPIGSVPIGNVPIGSIPIGSIPIGSIPIGSIALDATPLATLRIAAIPAAQRNTVVDCARIDCSDTSTATLHDAAAQSPSAIRPGAHLTDLAPAANAVTLAELVPGLVPVSALPWENLPVDGMQDVAPVTAAGVHYHLGVDIDCSTAPASISASAVLPQGFRYIAGSSTRSAGTGGATGVGDPLGAPAPLADVRESLTWTGLTTPCAGASGVQHLRLDFQAQPGLDLGTWTADASVATPGRLSVTGQAPVGVTDSSQPAQSAQTIAADALVISHLARPGDVDTFAIPVPAAGEGSRVDVSLSHLPLGTDLDLAVVRPVSSSVVSNPTATIPPASAVLPDPQPTLNDSGRSLAPETLSDVPIGSVPIGSVPIGNIPIGNVPLSGGAPLAGISQTRGNGDEHVAFIVAPGETGAYTVQVTGYNGSFSNRPFVLRYHVTPAPQVSAPARTFPNAAGPQGSLPSTVAPTTQTLLLVNESRMGALYGLGAESSLVAQLSTFAAQPGVLGTVIPVDGDAQTRADYAAWDAHPAVPALANAVVADIGALVARFRTPALRSVVLVGDDEALPMLRVPDLLTSGSESGVTRDLAYTLGGGSTSQANALYAAAALGDYLSDDAYGAFVATPWEGRDLYLPTVATGRLLETPGEITGQLTQYETGNGTLAPSTALVSGYDFLSDGAQAMAAGLATRLGNAAVDTSLINDSWTRTALLQKLTPVGGTPPAIDVVNAHYDTYQAEPAAALGTTPAPSDLVGTGDLPASSTGAFAGHIVFTLGCHGGLNVPDTLVPSPTAAQATQLLDWAQYYAQNRAAVYVANSGYGYGDTDTVGLGERLLTLFSQQFANDSLSLGAKLVAAKHGYYDTMGVYGAYDEKVLNELTLYGLPMYRISGTSTAPASTPQGVVTSTGAATSSVAFTTSTLSPAPAGSQPLTRHDTARGTFWSGPQNQVLTVEGRPLVPTLSVDVTRAGTIAHGVWTTGLVTTDLAGITPALARATLDSGQHEPAGTFVDETFPASPLKLTRSVVGSNDSQRLVLVAGQYRGQGVQRLVGSATGEVEYSTSGDTTPPLLGDVSAVQNPDGTDTVTVEAADAGSGITRVAALYLDGAGWHLLSLNRVSGTPVYTGSVNAGGAAIDVLAEAQDAAGNVGYSSNKGGLFHSVPSLTVTTAARSLATTEGGTVGGALATFTDPDQSHDPTSFSAVVAWGDGSASYGAIAYDPVAGAFTVSGSHTYADEGSYPVGITVTDADSSSGSTTSTASVADAPITLAPGSPAPIEGVTASPTLAFLSDGNPGATASDFTVSVDFGDGSRATASVTRLESGAFAVHAGHTWAEEGTYTVSVSAVDDGGQAANLSESVAVGDAPLSALAATVTATEGQSATEPVATFTDANTAAPLGDFSAVIHWGDGWVSDGTVVATGAGSFRVDGTHTFGEDRSYPVTVDIVDAGGQTARTQRDATVSDSSDLTTRALDIAEDALDGGDEGGSGPGHPTTA